ncbi:MAG: TonB-dependent receptor [Chitinophagaceae bacterium]|nr:TonB-dependent receptor [Chitinophagaceae bacterium]
MIRSLRFSIAETVFILLCFCLSSFAQTSANRITGTVTDENDQPLSNVSVVIIDKNKGVYTNENGTFLIKNVVPGKYVLKASLIGYEPVSMDVMVIDGNIVDIVFKLPLNATVLSNITVEAEREKETMQRLNDVEGTYLIAGVKNEVIELKNTELNVAQNYARSVFAKVPGVFVYEYDGSGNAVNVSTRGLDPHRSWEFNIRQNDIMINSDLYGYPANHYNPPMEAVEKVELIRGSAALQYGAQFGGMLNYKLHEADTTKPFSFHTQVSRGSYNFISTFTEAGGKAGKLSYYGFYNHRSADGYRDNSNYYYDAWHIGLNYPLMNNLWLKAEVSHMNYLNKLPGALNDSMFYENPKQSVRSRNYYNPNITVPGLNLTWNIKGRSTVNLITSAVLGDRNSVQWLGLATTPDTFNTKIGSYNPRQVDIDHFHSFSTELRFIHKYHFLRQENKFNVGYRFIHNNLHRLQQGTGTTGFDYDLTVVSDPAFKRDINYVSITNGLYAENLFQLTKNFSITPGLRFEMGQSDLKGKITYISDSDLPQTIDHNYILAGIRGEYKINKRNNVYGGWSQAYRPMILKDIVPATSFDQIDPDLKDATGYNADLGIRGNISEWLNYDISAFAVQYNDRIGTLVEVDDTGATYFFKTNVGNSLNYGLEVFAEFSPFVMGNFSPWIRGFSIYTSSAYMHARYTKGNVVASGVNTDVTGNKVETVPDWNLRSGISYRFKYFSASLMHSYVSEVYTDPLNTEQPNASGTLGIVPSYQIWDANAAWYYKNLNLKLNITNLADRSYFTKRPTFYPDPGIWPSDGRAITISFGVKI